jgi:hypothetical protein
MRCNALALEHLANPAQSLAGALFILDQSEADVTIAKLAEADAGADRDFGLTQQSG